MSRDNFKDFRAGLDSPASEHFAIAPDDDADLPRVPRVIYCETEGTVSIVDRAGTVLSYTMAQGDQLPFRGVRIRATGTTATVYGWD